MKSNQLLEAKGFRPCPICRIYGTILQRQMAKPSSAQMTQQNEPPRHAPVWFFPRHFEEGVSMKGLNAIQSCHIETNGGLGLIRSY